MPQFDLFSYIFLNSMGLFVLFNTNFIYEYANLFKLNNIKIFKEYYEYICKNDFINFITFLGLKDNFLCRLISCPLCFNFWSSLIFSLLLENINYIGLIYIISIIIHMGTSILYGKYKNI